MRTLTYFLFLTIVFGLEFEPQVGRLGVVGFLVLERWVLDRSLGLVSWKSSISVKI